MSNKKDRLDLCCLPDHVEYLHASDHGEEDQRYHQPNRMYPIHISLTYAPCK